MKLTSKHLATIALFVSVPVSVEAMGILSQSMSPQHTPSPMWLLTIALITMCTLQQKRSFAKSAKNVQR